MIIRGEKTIQCLKLPLSATRIAGLDSALEKLFSAI